MAEKTKSDKKKTGRGGKREGAGRPSTDSKLYSFRAPGYMAKVIDQQECKADFFKGCIKKYISEEVGLSKLGKIYKASEVKSLNIPFFDIGIVAGFPVPLDNDEKAQTIDLLRMLCPNDDSTYLIRVQGNSMIEANIHDGDMVIVDKSNRNPSEHEVAVCEFNGDYTLKRFVKRGNEGWLVSANPDFPEIRVTEDDDFSIWGTVTFVIHRPVND